MKRHTLLGVAALSACLLFFVTGCGGGGGATIAPSTNTPIPTVNNTNLSGVVTDVATGNPIANVVLKFDSGQQVKAGDDGKYQFAPSKTAGTITINDGAVPRVVPYDLSISSTKNISIMPTVSIQKTSGHISLGPDLNYKIMGNKTYWFCYLYQNLGWGSGVTGSH
jgi:hypothetical protein